MRIRVLGRFTAALAILTLVLCLLPGSTHFAVAKPFPNPDPTPADPAPKGDNDGVVLKAGRITNTGFATDRWGTDVAKIATGGRFDMRELRGHYALMMLRYWSFWVR